MTEIVCRMAMDKEDEKDEEWDTIADFTNVREGGIPFEEVLKHLYYATET